MGADPALRTVRIFLASSAELVDHRREFEIFINRQIKQLVGRNVFLELTLWEDFLDAMSATRLQEGYDHALQQCDLFVMLFRTKVGRYTAEEFERAFGQFKATGRPRIWTYFNDFPVTTGQVNRADMNSLWDFQEKLSSLGHFQTVYANHDALCRHFADHVKILDAEDFFGRGSSAVADSPKGTKSLMSGAGHFGVASKSLPTPLSTRARKQTAISGGSEPVQLAEPVDLAVFCQRKVKRSSRFLVQVLLYSQEDSEEAQARANEADPWAERRGVLSLPLDLPLGTQVDLRLDIPMLTVDEPDVPLIWRGMITAAQFEVFVPPRTPLDIAIGRVRLSIGGVPAGVLRFQVLVTSFRAKRKTRQAEISVYRYHQAFVSYASQDRSEVLKRVQAFRIAGLTVFQDILDLDPGDRWERKIYLAIEKCDVFLLFWSRAAAASKWVGMEIDYALALKGGEDDRPPDIQPVPIEGPPVPEPPTSLRYLHFNDALLAHISP